MWDIVKACNNTFQYVLNQREKAPKCTICNVHLFAYDEALNQYFTIHSTRKNDISFDMRHDIALWIFEHYPFHGQDKGKAVKHHLCYKDDISIFVCTSCHGKIHGSNEPKYNKWKPIDKRPKDTKDLGKKVIKPLG